MSRGEVRLCRFAPPDKQRPVLVLTRDSAIGHLATVAILRGQQMPSRRVVIRSSGVRVIRERTSLSQPEFAQLIGVSVKTLQNWEQDRRRPTGPAAALLSIIEHDPVLAVKAIHWV